MTHRQIRSFFWNKVVPQVYPQIKFYPRDLLLHDWNSFKNDPNAQYLLAVDDYGTYCYNTVTFRSFEKENQDNITHRHSLYLITPIKRHIEKIDRFI